MKLVQFGKQERKRETESRQMVALGRAKLTRLRRVPICLRSHSQTLRPVSADLDNSEFISTSPTVSHSIRALHGKFVRQLELPLPMLASLQQSQQHNSSQEPPAQTIIIKLNLIATIGWCGTNWRLKVSERERQRSISLGSSAI